MSGTLENERTKKLCMDLARADSAEEVINVLKGAGYWDNPGAWRDYGDLEGNFATIGNQASRPEAALVEKIMNSVDARLMNEYLRQCVDQATIPHAHAISEAMSPLFKDTVESKRAISRAHLRIDRHSNGVAGRRGFIVRHSANHYHAGSCFSSCNMGQSPARR